MVVEVVVVEEDDMLLFAFSGSFLLSDEENYVLKWVGLVGDVFSMMVTWYLG